MEKKVSKTKNKTAQSVEITTKTKTVLDHDNLIVEESVSELKTEKKSKKRVKTASPVLNESYTEHEEVNVSLPKSKKRNMAEDTPPSDSVIKTDAAKVQIKKKKDKTVSSSPNAKVLDVSKIKKKRSREAYQRRRKMAKEKAKSKRAKKI